MVKYLAIREEFIRFESRAIDREGPYSNSIVIGAGDEVFHVESRSKGSICGGPSTDIRLIGSRRQWQCKGSCCTATYCSTMIEMREPSADGFQIGYIPAIEAVTLKIKKI